LKVFSINKEVVEVEFLEKQLNQFEKTNEEEAKEKIKKVNCINK
jgi:hypothetical protein